MGFCIFVVSGNNMSTCLSHLFMERGLMVSGSTKLDDYSKQLEEMFSPPRVALILKRPKKKTKEDKNV